MSQFSDLGLAAPILKALTAEGYAEPTPIQSQAIPLVLEGRDVIALAQTGTGKTAAFALPLLDRLSQKRFHAGAKACRALILAPTRELAAQIGDSFRAYGRFLGLSTAVVFGGASMFKQKQALYRGVDILVATPGRLLDHVSQRSVTLEHVEILVLDEADHMLDMGFIHDLRRITKLLPQKRQSLLFSATMPEPIRELAAQFLTEPAQVAVTPPSTTAERVEQSVVHVDQGKKQDLLHGLLADPAVTRALVFSRTKHGADRVVKRLVSAGFAADAIHGNKSQGQRIRALEAFKKGAARVLVATEIAARGIDVDGVSHVFNFDLPNVPEQYVHRIGRTARGGAVGQAISFCAPDERAYLRDIERLTKQSVPVLETDWSLPAPQPRDPVAKPKQGGRKRPSQNGQGQNAQGQGNRGQNPQGPKRSQSSKPQRAAGAGPKGQRSEPRADGEFRSRKGEMVWSNSPAPRRPQRNGQKRRDASR